MKVLVSACLLGENCKYNGGNNENARLMELLAGHEIFAVCPEVDGGLPIPRVPAEIVDGVVTTKSGVSVDREFRQGAEVGLHIALDNGIEYAILQSRSPSCGVKQIYDGTFTGNKIEGKGVFAELLAKNNVKLLDVEDLDIIKKILDNAK